MTTRHHSAQKKRCVFSSQQLVELPRWVSSESCCWRVRLINHPDLCEFLTTSHAVTLDDWCIAFKLPSWLWSWAMLFMTFSAADCPVFFTLNGTITPPLMLMLLLLILVQILLLMLLIPIIIMIITLMVYVTVLCYYAVLLCICNNSTSSFTIMVACEDFV